MRRAAANALGRVPTASAEAALVGALQDPDWTVRACAVSALGWPRLPPRQAARLLRDLNAEVRRRAGLAAGADPLLRNGGWESRATTARGLPSQTGSAGGR